MGILDGIISARQAYTNETGSELVAITIDSREYDFLLAEIASRFMRETQSGDDREVTIVGVRVLRAIAGAT